MRDSSGLRTGVNLALANGWLRPNNDDGGVRAGITTAFLEPHFTSTARYINSESEMKVQEVLMRFCELSERMDGQRWVLFM